MLQVNKRIDALRNRVNRVSKQIEQREGTRKQIEIAKQQKYLLTHKHQSTALQWKNWCLSLSIPRIQVCESRAGYARVQVTLPDNKVFSDEVFDKIQEVANTVGILHRDQAREYKDWMTHTYFYRESESSLSTSFKLIPTDKAVRFAQGIVQILSENDFFSSPALGNSPK